MESKLHENKPGSHKRARLFFFCCFLTGAFATLKTHHPKASSCLPSLRRHQLSLPGDRFGLDRAIFCRISSLFGGGLEELLHSSSAAAAFAHGYHWWVRPPLLGAHQRTHRQAATGRIHLRTRFTRSVTRGDTRPSPPEHAIMQEPPPASPLPFPAHFGVLTTQ